VTLFASLPTIKNRLECNIQLFKGRASAGLGDEKPGELAKFDSKLNQKCWYPIFFQFVSKDTEHTEHQILLIVMPSGVATKNLSGVSMEVEDEG
jgi:hypothetical protein